MTAIPLRNRNAPAVRAEEAFRLFCSPEKHRPPHYRKLAHRARFHLRHASVRPYGEIQTYAFEPSRESKGTVLLIHGWGAEASFLVAFAEPLRRLGIRVLALDLPAHGRSAGTRTTLAACARAAHRIAASFSPIAGIIGHSLGGLISLWVAEGGAPLSFPIPVGKLALLACPNRFLDVTRTFGAGLNLCDQAQLGFERRLSRVGHRPVKGFSAVNLIKRIRSNVMAVHSVDDERISFADAEAIGAASPRVKLVACQGLGHAKLLYDPAVIRGVISFLVQG
jgi:pimeloyl-ACP methyl ester carboxylesterase